MKEKNKDSKEMVITNVNTVKFNGNEMNLDTFFSVLNRNIDDTNYSVYYSKSDKEFTIYYDGIKYQVKLDKKLSNDLENNISNPIINQLVSLSRVQEMVDLPSNEAIIASEVLDDESKIVYLKNLKSKKFSFKQYLINLFTDFDDTKEVTFNRFGEYAYIHAAICLLGCVLGAIISLLMTMGTENPIYCFWMLLGIPVVGAELVLQFDFLLAGKRFKRLINAISNKRIRKTKIKKLERSLKNNTLLLSSGEVTENKIMDNQEIKSIIPVMINKLIELLKEVNPDNRGSLTSEIKAFLLEYQQMISDTTKTDRELFIENKSIRDRIVDLELRINAARRISDNRKYETNYLLGKIDNLDGSLEVVEEQKTFYKAL